MPPTKDNVGHGALFDLFPERAQSVHGGNLYDQGFGLQNKENVAGALFDEFGSPVDTELHGQLFDDWRDWTSMPDLHGGFRYDSGFATEVANSSKQGPLFDLFEPGTQAKYIFNGQDSEGLVLRVEGEYAVVQPRGSNGAVEVGLDQFLGYRSPSLDNVTIEAQPSGAQAPSAHDSTAAGPYPLSEPGPASTDMGEISAPAQPGGENPGRSTGVPDGAMSIVDGLKTRLGLGDVAKGNVKLIDHEGKRWTEHVADDFPYRSLGQGKCRGCAGSGKRDFDVQGRRAKGGAPCRDCGGTGEAHIHANSVAGRGILGKTADLEKRSSDYIESSGTNGYTMRRWKPKSGLQLVSHHAPGGERVGVSQRNAGEREITGYSKGRRLGLFSSHGAAHGAIVSEHEKLTRQGAHKVTAAEALDILKREPGAPLSMTRQHFAHIAHTIHAAQPESDRPKLAHAFGEHLQATNPGFKRDRFEAASLTGKGAKPGASFTRGHYQHIAGILKSSGNGHQAEHFASHLAGTNPHFKSERFVDAAKIRGLPSDAMPSYSMIGQSITKAVSPGGWTKIQTGEGPSMRPGGGRPIHSTVSKRVFEYRPNLMDTADPRTPLKHGDKVRIAKLHGAPAPGTMGHYHVAHHETGKFLGLVHGNSLHPVGKTTGGGADVGKEVTVAESAIQAAEGAAPFSGTRDSGSYYCPECRESKKELTEDGRCPDCNMALAAHDGHRKASREKGDLNGAAEDSTGKCARVLTDLRKAFGSPGDAEAGGQTATLTGREGSRSDSGQAKGDPPDVPVPERAHPDSDHHEDAKGSKPGTCPHCGQPLRELDEKTAQGAPSSPAPGGAAHKCLGSVLDTLKGFASEANDHARAHGTGAAYSWKKVKPTGKSRALHYYKGQQIGESGSSAVSALRPNPKIHASHQPEGPLAGYSKVGEHESHESAHRAIVHAHEKWRAKR